MKRKTIVWVYLFILSLGTILSLYIPKNEVAAKEDVVIPGQAIRLRILANSDLNADQALKHKVRDAVTAKISVWVKDLTSYNQARKVIESKLPELRKTAEEVVKQQGSKQTVKVQFGKVQFPTKLYGDFLYPAGEYEALLITLGKGEGANWWCVLFPPLCFLDFSNGVAVSAGFEDQNPKPAAAAPKVKDTQTTQTAGQQVDQPSDTANSADQNQEPAKSVHTADQHVDQAADQTQTAANQDADQSQAVGQDTDQAAGQSQTVSQDADQAQKADPSQTADQGHASSDTTASANQQNSNQQTAGETQSNQTASQDQNAGSEQGATDAEQTGGQNSSADSVKKQAPVYTADDEQPIKVKFFFLELWNKLF